MRMYYVSGFMGEGAKRMFHDLEHQEHVKVLEEIVPGKIKRYLFFRIYNIAKKHGFFDRIRKFFYNWYSVFGVRQGAGDCFVFVNSWFLCFYDAEMILKLRKKYPEMKMVLYIVDPMEGFSSEDNRKVVSLMDAVYSVHEADCQKYGFHYYPLVYSKADGQEEDGSIQNDLYYIGSGTDRTALLREIAGKCGELGLRTDFHIVAGDQKEQEDSAITFHRNPVSYSENERMLKGAACILEMMHEGFAGLTQRYVEAVVYNKKLLTNNINISRLEFYNPAFMRVFHTADEINADFFDNGTVVDYGYTDEFSPVHLIEHIEEQLSGRNEWIR